MSDPTTATVADPRSVDEPSLVPQGEADDPGQEGNAQPASDGGESPQDNAPELPKWAYQLTDDLKSNDVVTKHEKLNDLVSEYAEYASKADRLIELPGDDADEQAKVAFLDRLRPESPEAYELEQPELPEGLTYNKDEENRFRSFAHEMGLTNEQAKELHKWDAERMANAYQQQAAQRKEKFDGLRKDWGDNFDERVREAQQAFKEIANRLGDEGLAERMVKTGSGNDPDMLRTFYGIWQMIKPDTIVDGSVDGGGPDSIAETWYPQTSFEDS